MTPYWDLGPLFERFPLTVFGVSVGISFDSNALTVQRTEAVNGVLTIYDKGAVVPTNKTNPNVMIAY
jgi:hypothetical protein